jgi:16S rRNA (guanine966-N2)-methyltransferase
MRIVGGRWAGMPLTSPGPRIRPTMEAARVIAMEMLGADLSGARFLDAFAGTGAVGLEALSRGAAQCDFVEDGTAAAHGLKANVAKVRARERIRVFFRDAIPFVERLAPGTYDIAFVDPPYGSRKLDRVLDCWYHTQFSHILLVEHPVDHPISVPAGCRWKSRQVEDTLLTLVRRKAGASLEAQDPHPAGRLPRDV